MVQESLVEYISSQIKAGVGRDAVKASLVSAGWQAADVEDTLKKVEGGKSAQPGAAAGASAFPATGMSSKAAEPQMIRVTDLISAPASSSSASPASTAASAAPKDAAKGSAKVFSKESAAASKPAAMTSSLASASSVPMGSSLKTRSGLIGKIIAIVIIVALAGLAGFLYFQNNGLTAKVASLNTMSTDVTGQIASLNTEVTALDASNTALAASGDALTQQNSELSLELSFYAMPPGGSTESIGPVNISGALSGGGKTPYLITTSYGAKIYVQNSKDADVVAAFATSTGNPVQVSGTYVQGSQNIMITAVNGTPVAK